MNFLKALLELAFGLLLYCVIMFVFLAAIALPYRILNWYFGE